MENLEKILRKINLQKLPNEASKYWVAEGRELTIRYECHTEFISLTIIYPNGPIFIAKLGIDEIPL